MQTPIGSKRQRGPFGIPLWLGVCLFLAIALFFLWEEHKAHILGALPYALLLLCPLIHVFMHRGHGAHGGDQAAPAGHDHQGEGGRP